MKAEIRRIRHHAVDCAVENLVAVIGDFEEGWFSAEAAHMTPVEKERVAAYLINRWAEEHLNDIALTDALTTVRYGGQANA